MPKKTKITKIPTLSADHYLATTPSVFNIPKQVEKDSKVRAKDVFEGYQSKSRSKKKSK
jgi:hypothetical protein